ncbi:MAG TPA: 3-hydroxyacyl-CoA dehydrogenase family protein [Acidimicrobiia bacterium]|nr:3-hydroxyacyl-CoA dehydrogenase family protein [Acidimicrobiia bacterium]
MGAGTMGTGIAITAIRAGFATMLADAVPAQLPVALDHVDRFLGQSVQRGKLTAVDRDAALDRLSLAHDFERLADCDIVIESISEDLHAKQELFRGLGECVPQETVYVTNTSTLSVTAISAGAVRPDRLVGMHFCNPAPLMHLIEVVDGMLTSATTHALALELARALGKTAVEVKDTPGFIVNRLLIPFENACIRELEHGAATVEDIDRAVRFGLGYPMGPFQLLDTVGLDVHRAVSLSMFEQLRDPVFAPPPLVDQMIAVGHLGRKTGRGFYQYDEPGMFGA